MTIEQRQHANGSTYPTATACPFCEVAIDEQESLAKHLRHHCDGD